MLFNVTHEERQRFVQALEAEMNKTREILVARGQDYNQGDVFASDYGNGEPQNWWTLMWFKLLRARSSIQLGDKARLKDSLRDLANYAFLLLADIETGNMDNALSYYSVPGGVVVQSLEGDHSLEPLFVEDGN